MINFDVLTLFPQMFDAILKDSIIGRAIKKNIIKLNCHNIRDYTVDKHKKVDDSPYGGGKGMIMQAQPIYDCYNEVIKNEVKKPHTIYMSPQGKTLTQKKALKLSKLNNIVILCGHYEGVDQRILDEIVDEEISIGNFVLTGGEIPALALIDCISRLVQGVLADDVCFTDESHFSGLLEYPQYTRPPVFLGKKVPEVLLSGNHKEIEKFKKEKAIEVTKKKRKDLINKIK